MNRKNLILFAVSLLFSLPAFAQVVEPQIDSSKFYESLVEIPQYTHSDSVEFGLIPPDVIEEVVDTVKTIVTEDRGFNAKNLRMQKRFTSPDKTSFSVRQVFSNMFGGISYDYVVPIGMSVLYGPNVSIYVGKQFTRISSARISATGGVFYNIPSGDKPFKIGLSADYLLNLSSLIGGYDKYRLFEVSALAGVGFHSNLVKGSSSAGVKGRVGANLNFHVLKFLDVFVEPRMELYGENPFKLPGSDMWRRYSSAFAVSFGVSARILDTVKWPQNPGINWYALAMGGPQFQNSRQVHTLGVGNMLGGAAAAGVGFHYLKWLDFRLLADYSTCGWSVGFDGKRKNTQYFGARFEALFDVVNMITGRDNTMFSAGLFFGPELGGMKKETDVNDINNPAGLKPVPDIRFAYFGVTAGLQVGCRVMSNIRVILEPRLSIVPYLNPARANSDNYYNRYYDMPIGVNLGVEYHFGNNK